MIEATTSMTMAELIAVINANFSSTTTQAPVAATVLYPAAIAPIGWLLCQGQAVSRTTYSALFDAIGDTYGNGDGSTTFNLPNLKGKVPVGLDSSDADFDTLGETGGEKTHALTEAEMGIDNYGLIGASGSFFGVHGHTTPTTAHNNVQPYITVNYIIKY